ncbi:PREDICTED: uncharacterized protein LOC107188953 [Dufourea novaeangliae]|uniref:uncharacterized protein LOC107188953 n=1 Tax=Dufourea novaeangliae TaxID=178035 RepID=UPI0007676DF8|nr:PREDICTED: uncharacterized protein LOC107188953 [Dufourea novaeangliae]
MNLATVLLTLSVVLAIGLSNGQLNFEGNPLTENTEYTAEESRFSRRTARQGETAANATSTMVTEFRSQKLYPVHEDAKNASKKPEPKNRPVDSADRSELGHPSQPENLITVQPEAVQTSRQLLASVYNQANNVINPAEMALNTFLNSKTPEESRMSLDTYLENADGSQNVLVGEQPGQQTVSSVNQQQLSRHTVQLTSPVDQQSVALSSPVNQHLTAQLMQQRQPLQPFPVVNQRQHLNGQVYNIPVNPMDPRLPHVSGAVGAPLPQQIMQTPYAQGLQARNDIFYPVGWHQRVRRIRGRPFPYTQSRGGPGFHGGPVPVPYKPKVPPVEVIYTKPPGFNRGPPPVLGNPPMPYEDASAWFPEADQPPPAKDVYYSQLYAQSYDPHYYNYIAKTGKIKPHLYGKLGKYDDNSNSIWSDLYRGFKKHGLKNIMTPTFLLGMTLPVVTLMLTALVQKRSFAARSDSREFSREETIQEYMEQLQRAVECYERKRTKRDTSFDGC